MKIKILILQVKNESFINIFWSFYLKSDEKIVNGVKILF